MKNCVRPDNKKQAIILLMLFSYICTYIYYYMYLFKQYTWFVFLPTNIVAQKEQSRVRSIFYLWARIFNLSMANEVLHEPNIQERKK